MALPITGWFAEVAVTISAPTMTATASMLVPAQIGVLGTDVAAPVMQAVAAMLAPSASGSGLAVPPTMTASVAMLAPSFKVAVGAPVMDATAMMLAPGVFGSAAISAPVMVSTASMPVPFVGTGTSNTVAAPTMTGTAGMLAPSVVEAIAAPLATALGQMLAPVVNTSAAVNAPLITGSAAMLTPSVIEGIAVPLMTGSAAMLVPSPTVTSSAVTFDAKGAGLTGALTNPSWSHTIGSGANCLIVALGTDAGLPSAVKCGTTSMTNIVPSGDGAWSGGYLTMWYLLNPPTGAQTISVTCADSYTAAGSVSYNGVTGVANAAYQTNLTTSPFTATGVTTSGYMQVAAFASSGATTFSAFSGTSRFNDAEVSSVNYPFVMGDIACSSTNNKITAAAAAYCAVATVVLQ